MAGTSLVTLAKRALVTLLLAFARQYQIPALVINRDSPDKDILTAFKKVARRIHPDKGGSTSDFQRLNNARDEWEKAKSQASGTAAQALSSTAAILRNNLFQAAIARRCRCETGFRRLVFHCEKFTFLG